LKKLTILAILLTFVLAACGAASKPVPELTQSMSSESIAGATLTVTYPDGWFAEDQTNANITITNTQSLLTSGAEGIRRGQIMLFIGLIDSNGLSESIPVLSPRNIVARFSQLLSNGQASDDDFEELTINGHETVIAKLESDTGGEGATLIVMEIDGNYVMISAMTKANEVESYQELVRAIVATISLDG